ncbi:MAG: DNA translocase FtsK [Candidatus Coatesbacteria bacterium]
MNAPPGSRLKHVLEALGLWLASALVFLSLVARERSGAAGFWLGNHLADLFGACAVALPILLATAGVWVFRAEAIREHAAALGGLALFTGGVATLLGDLPDLWGERLAGGVGVWCATTATDLVGLPGLLLTSACAIAAGGWLGRHEPVVHATFGACRWTGAALWRATAAAARGVKGWIAGQRLTRRTVQATSSGVLVTMAPPVRPVPPPPAVADDRVPEPSFADVVRELADDEASADATADAAGASTPSAADGEDPATPARPKRRRKAATRWTLPSQSLLSADTNVASVAALQGFIQEQIRILDATLAAFKVEGKIVSVTPGARVILFEWAPAPGVKANRLESLQDDLTLALKAERVRVVVPLPGKGTVGIEIPHPAPAGVTLGGIMAAHAIPQTGSSPNPSASAGRDAGDLALYLGRALTGEPMVSDLAQMPHLLIAGTTGSGKSVCIHTALLSLMMTRSPDELRLVLIDPKRVELIAYREAPHLLSEVITDSKMAVMRLRWLGLVMESRYELLARHGCRDLHVFNRMVAEEGLPEESNNEAAVLSPSGLPWIVVAIDELADLMVARAREVEDALQRLAQMARGVGIHLIVATQRPSVDVLTGVIKANLPSRISFQVATRVDSRTILDSGGAEQLLGRGDMLYAPAGLPAAIRGQGAFVSPAEVKAVLGHWTAQGDPDFVAVADVEGPGGDRGEEAGGDDPLYAEAVELVIKSGEASVSQLQRRLGIGFARAGRLIDLMERRGVVGPKQGSKTREILARRPGDDE